MRRGFTLVELMMVTGIFALVLGGAYHLLYEVRSQLRVGEVDLQLSREAQLIEEAWRRDGHAASAIGTAQGLAELETRDGPVRWRLEDGVLLREDASGVVLLAAQVAGARVESKDGLWRLALELSRDVGEVRRTLAVDAVVSR